MITRVRCGELGRSPIDLFADWLAGGHAPSCADEFGRTVVYTRSGREAIALAMRRWNVGSGDEVLVPAYNCGSEVSPIMATGARVLMYRVDGHAEIDIGDIRRRLSARTKIVLVTHYFGRPADLRELAPLCRDAGVKLLEDCAHSLFGAGLGGIGDAAIFSLRKTLPASDGGVLAIRPSGLRGEDGFGPESPPPVAARGTLSLAKRWLQRGFWIGAGAFSSEADQVGATNVSSDASLPDIPVSYYFARGAPVVGASRLARGLLKRTDKAEVADRRCRNYRHLLRLIEGVRGFAPLWGEKLLEPRVCPLGLPGLVEDRDLWRGALNRAGVNVSPWWAGFHRGLDWSEFTEARTLKRQLILLPVHQGLTGADMEYIAAAARGIGW
jgi:perosamine synthetase